MAGVGECGGRAVGGEGVGKQGYAGGGQGLLPYLHQRQGGFLKVFAQGGGQFAAAVAQCEGRADGLAFD